MGAVHGTFEARPSGQDDLHLAPETVRGPVHVRDAVIDRMRVQMQSGTYAVETSHECIIPAQVQILYPLADGGQGAFRIQFRQGVRCSHGLVGPDVPWTEQNASAEITLLHHVGIGHGDVTETCEGKVLQHLVSESAGAGNENAESMDPGDVQIVTNICIWEDADLDKEEIKVLAKIDQNNYTQNDKNELDFLSGAGDVVLFTLHAEDDGSYSVTDARFAEDGEGYLSSIEAFCDEVGTPLEDCMQTIDFADVMVLYDLEEYLNQHPDIKGIEYAGEVVDLEGLKTAQDNLLDLLLSEEDAEM
jgi:hypothetical protein